MKGIVLGAGYGVRLHPLTKNRPKPLLPVAGRPMMEWVFNRLATVKDLDTCYIISNAAFYDAYLQWLKTYTPPVNVILLNDGSTTPENKLGAVRDIQFTIDMGSINDNVLVVAGDNLFELELTKFVEFARPRGASIVLKDMKNSSLISEYSVVTIDNDQRIINFEEKPPMPKTSLISTCIYYFPKETLPMIKEYLDTGNIPDAPGYYIQWLYKQIPVYGYVYDGPWYDIGDIDSYNKANDDYARKT